MRKTSVLILFILLMVFISGCESFPYVVEIMTKTPAADTTSVPEATATLPIVHDENASSRCDLSA